MTLINCYASSLKYRSRTTTTKGAAWARELVAEMSASHIGRELRPGVFDRETGPVEHAPKPFLPMSPVRPE
jgi:hypothetical protein